MGFKPDVVEAGYFSLLVFRVCPFCVRKEEDHRQIQKSGTLLFEKLLMKPFENDFVGIVHSVNSMSDHHTRNCNRSALRAFVQIARAALVLRCQTHRSVSYL